MSVVNMHVSVVNMHVSVVNMQVSVVNMQVSVVNLQVSIVNMQVSVVNMRVSVVNMQVSVVNMRVTVVNMHVRICSEQSCLCILYTQFGNISIVGGPFCLLIHDSVDACHSHIIISQLDVGLHLYVCRRAANLHNDLYMTVSIVSVYTYTYMQG